VIFWRIEQSYPYYTDSCGIIAFTIFQWQKCPEKLTNYIQQSIVINPSHSWNKHKTNILIVFERKKERKYIYWTAHKSKTDTGSYKNRNKYATNFTLDTTIHRKCSPNGAFLSLCFCGTRRMSQERCCFSLIT
jgi:hypothetical protein